MATSNSNAFSRVTKRALAVVVKFLKVLYHGLRFFNVSIHFQIAIATATAIGFSSAFAIEPQPSAV